MPVQFRKLSRVLALLSCLLLSSVAHTYELFLTQEEAAIQGYVPYHKKMVQWAVGVLSQRGEYVPHALKWPFEEPYKGSHIGNNFLQFQPYDNPGYHQGADMLLEADSWAVSPVDGVLEAGHYGYTDLPNGDRIKQWIPWPKPGNEMYFEIAVTDANGYRYEFHHINRQTLPKDIIAALNSGKGFVKAGQRVGQVIDWPTMNHYVHVHLNVYGPTGITMNPESFFEIIPDSIAPAVKFLAIYQDNSTEWLTEGTKLSKPVKSFIISGSDAKNRGEYVQAVPVIKLLQKGMVIAQLNFSETLINDLGVFTDIREVYPLVLQLSDKTILEQPDDYYPIAKNGVKFHQQLMVKGAEVGQAFQLRAQDIAGNVTVLNGTF